MSGKLIHCGLVMAYGDIDLGQHWLRWRHQSVTWTNDDFSLVRFCGIHLRVISQPKPMLLFCKLKIILLKLQPHLSGSSKVNLVSPVTTSWCSYVNSDCVEIKVGLIWWPMTSMMTSSSVRLATIEFIFSRPRYRRTRSVKAKSMIF